MFSSITIHDVYLRGVEVKDLAYDTSVFTFKNDNNDYADIYVNNRKQLEQIHAILDVIGEQKRCDIAVSSTSIIFLLPNLNIATSASELCGISWEPFFSDISPVPMI